MRVIQIETKWDGLDTIIDGLNSLVNPQKAVNIAISRTLKKARTIGARDITSKYAIKYGTALSSFTLKQGNMQGTITSRTPMVPIESQYKFKPGKTPKPYSGKNIQILVAKYKGWKEFKGLFVANGRLYTRKGKERYPIQHRYSISAAQMFLSNRAGLEQQVPEDMWLEYSAELAQTIFAMLSGYIKQ